MRDFLPNQLLACEAELLLVGSIATELGWDLGDLSDRQHWDGAVAEPVGERADHVIAEIRRATDRVDGLLKAYQMVLNARAGTEETG